MTKIRMRSMMRAVRKMMVLVLIALLLVVPAAACAPSGTGETDAGKLRVLTSFYVLYDFTSKIGGEHVSVTNLVPPGIEPHDWEPGTQEVILLEQADMLVYNGAGMEHWTGKILPSLSTQSLVLVETAAGLDLLTGSHSHDDSTDHEEESTGDAGTSGHDQDENAEHAAGSQTDDADHDNDQDKDHEEELDPHVWLSPVNARHQMRIIRDALVAADPDHAADYQANYDRYAAELDALDTEFRQALADVKRREIVVAHEAFGYLCREYGLIQLGIEGLASETEPDPARMAEIVDFARDHDVQVIFFETLASPKVAQAIASEIGARTAVLNPLEGLDEEAIDAGEDYFSIMRQNLEALVDALS